MAARLDFPTHDTMSATLLAVTAVGLVLAQVGPYVRGARDLQRAWADGKTASLDVLRKLENANSSRGRVVSAVEGLSGLTPNNAVKELRAARRIVDQAVQDFELAVLALDTFESKMSALLKHRVLLRHLKPKVAAESLSMFESMKQQSAKLRESLGTVRDAGMLEQFDEMIDLAVSHATAYAVAQSADLAKAKPRGSVEEALGTLRRIHDTMRASGMKA